MTAPRHFLSLLAASLLVLACSGPDRQTSAGSTGATVDATSPDATAVPTGPSTTDTSSPAAAMADQPIADDSSPAASRPAARQPAANQPAAEPAPAPAAPTTPQTATFGGGCFWCTEAVLEQQPGVLDVVSGYMGGSVDDPSYEQVCSGTTGHAEVVQVTFDPQRISYDTLLDWFFRSHDATQLNRQGADIGTQYRSVIFFHSPEQQQQALAFIKQLQPTYQGQIVTELSKAPKFWPAEEYHQDYFARNPNQGYCRAVIAPKIKKLGLDLEPKKQQ